MQIELKLRQTNVRAGQGNGQVSGCDWDWGIVWVWWQLVGRESGGWWWQYSGARDMRTDCTLLQWLETGGG